MSDREDDRDRGMDDLFGDLDEFFAPIEDVEWAEEERAASEEPSEEPPGEPEGTAEAKEPPGEAEETTGAEEIDEDWSPKIDIPEEDELLAGLPEEEEAAEPVAPKAREEEPPEEAVDEAVEDQQEEAVEEPPEEVPSVGPEMEEAAAGAGKPPLDEATATPSVGETEAAGEATAEMSGEEWDRLREALGDEEAEEEAEVPSAEERELSVDDLRAAPPEYVDLPQAEGGDVEDEEEGAEIEGRPDTEEPVEEEPVLAEEAVIGGEDVPAEGPEDDRAAETSPEEVEAAADHFASGLRASPDEVERDLLSDLGGGPEGEEREPEEVEVSAEPVPTEEEPLGAGPPPTWQEPAARVEEEEEVEAAAPAAGERNLPAAVVSGIIVAGAAIALLAISKGAFVVLAVGLVLLGQGELYGVMKARGYQPATALGLVAGAFVMIGAYVRGDTGQGEAAVLLGLALGMLFSVFWYTAAPPKARRGLLANVAATMFGVVYVPLLVSFALLLLAFPGSVGRNMLLIVVGLTVLYDVVAYAVGTLWGSRPLAPSISPHKSWEGVIGATFVLLLVGLAIVPNFAPFRGPDVGDPMGVAAAVGLALVIAVAAPLGDLVESAVKRDLGVKDMGSLLPGHGGVLDRIDAILFAAPAAYFFIRLAAF